jgi:hypothetical protein
MTAKHSQEVQEAIDSVKHLSNEHDYEEWRMRFAEHKELCILNGIYDKVKQLETAAETETEQRESEEMEAVRNYLEPLDLAPVGTSIVELARLAALKLMEKE